MCETCGTHCPLLYSLQIAHIASMTNMQVKKMLNCFSVHQTSQPCVDICIYGQKKKKSYRDKNKVKKNKERKIYD